MNDRRPPTFGAPSTADAPLAVVRGGGDLGTGAARRLWLAGLRVIVTERDAPWCVRRQTAFATAVTDGRIEVEGVSATRKLAGALGAGVPQPAVAVVVWPDGPGPPGIHPDVLVDARVLKWGHDTRLDDAARVIGVGPGFRVDRDCHAAVETVRGHDMGRVLYCGETLPFSGRPGAIGRETDARVMRSPVAGRFRAMQSIGAQVHAGERVGVVAGRPVLAAIPGVIRGLLAEGTEVIVGQKVGDVDPRNDPHLCQSLSDKANAVGGGVVEAALALLARP